MQRPRFHGLRNHQQVYNPHNNRSFRFPSNHPHFNSIRPPYNQYRPTPGQNQNDEHWCETCDRSFYSADLLEKHKQQHQKCNIDGCQFIAHPKVITKHIQMQHASGLYKKIANINNPEEIQKWREERKKKYPTKVNIEKKAAEIKEKIDRGEKMGLNQNRHNRQFNRGNVPNNKNAHTNENNQHNKRRQPPRANNTSALNKIKKPFQPKKVHNVMPTADSLRKLKPFAGIQDIAMEFRSEEDVTDHTNCDFIIEDDDGESLVKPEEKKTLVNDNEPKVCGALSSLMCDYDSSDDDKTEDILTKKDIILEEPVTKKSKTAVTKDHAENITTSKATVKIGNSSSENIENNNKSDDEGPVEIKIDKNRERHAVEVLPETKESNTNRKKIFVEKKPNRNQYNNRFKHKIPSTLLQKLLRKEVQQERNIVLQCVRHIVKNNFFDENKQI